MKQGNGTVPLSFTREGAEERLRFESAGEYALPDYRPEVRRVLALDTRVLPSGSYRAGGRAEYAGVCVHTVLYSAGDGSLASAELTTEYSFSFPAEESASLSVEPPTVEQVSCRLGGPRKISVRAVMSARARTLTPESRGEALSELLRAEDTVALSHPISLSEPHLLTAGDLGYRETILRDGELTPLLVRATPTVTEASLSEGNVRVRGETVLHLLCSSGDGLPDTVTKSVPFEVMLPCEREMGEVGCVHARAALTGLDISAVPSDRGGTAITADFTLELEAELLCRRTLTPIIDLFSTKTPLKCLREEIPITETVLIETHERTVSTEVPRSESDSEDASAVLDASAAVRLREESREGGMLVLSGDCRTELALALGLSDAEGRLGHSASSYSSPVSLSLPLPENLPEGAVCDAHARVLSVTGRLEPQSLAADCKLSITLRYLMPRSISVAVGAEKTGEAYPPLPESELVAVYPEESDSLWSLARRYRVSPERLAAENGLPDSAVLDADLSSSLDGRAGLIVSYLES